MLGAPGLSGALADALRAASPRAEPVLRALGVTGVPVGVPVSQLAAWAAAQPGAERVVARPGSTLVARLVDADTVHRAYRRNRALRRTRWATFALGAVTGLGAILSWDRATDARWLAVTGAFAGVFVLLAIGWLVLGRMLNRGST